MIILFKKTSLYFKLLHVVMIVMVLLGFNVLHAELSQTEENLIPFQAHLTSDFTPPGVVQAIPAGFRFVVLRPLDGGMVLGEFPRRGNYAVDLDRTDIMQNLIGADGVLANSTVVPRMSYFFANKIVSGNSNWLNPLRSDVVNKYSRWIIIYGNSDEPQTLDAIEAANRYYSQLSTEDRAQILVVYMDPLGNKANLKSIAEQLTPSIQTMPGYLSKGYSKTLAHFEAEDSMPVVVEVQSSGRVISKQVGLDQVQNYFRKIKE